MNNSIDGITAIIMLSFGVIFGLFFLFEGFKKDAKLLKTLGVLEILVGLSFLGVFIDYISVLANGSNLISDRGEVAILSYIFAPWLPVIGVYIANEILMSKHQKKWIITLIYFCLLIIFTLIITIFPLNSFDLNYPIGYPNNPQGLVDYNIKILSIPGIITVIFIMTLIIYPGIGIFINALKLTGDIRKKMISIANGFLFLGIFGFLESLTNPTIILIIVRIGFISSTWLMYYGLKN
jgi:hypothetical protein